MACEKEAHMPPAKKYFAASFTTNEESAAMAAVGISINPE